MPNGLTKLNELLAVNTNVEGQATKTATDLRKTFETKRHLFESKLVTFRPDTEGAPAVTEAQSDIQSTVAKELEWITGILASSFDVGYQIDVANTTAKADIVTETDEVIAKDVPATALLQLEKELKNFRELLLTVPTLDPAKGFTTDSTREHGVFKAHEVQKSRTKKVTKPIVLYPATDKHPAQVQLVSEDVSVGTIQEQEWSSLITPAMKSELIERVEILTRAVKKARARANNTEVDVATNKIGRKLLGFVLKPLVKK